MSHDTFMDVIAGRSSDCAAVWVGPVLCVYPTNSVELAVAFTKAALATTTQPHAEIAGERRSGGSDSA